MAKAKKLSSDETGGATTPITSWMNSLMGDSSHMLESGATKPKGKKKVSTEE